jgi:hypothetical protein
MTRCLSYTHTQTHTHGQRERETDRQTDTRHVNKVFIVHTHKHARARHKQVMELVLFDEARALKMLVSSTDKIAVAHVVAQLQGERRLVYAYLDLLFDKVCMCVCGVGMGVCVCVGVGVCD